MLCPAMEIVSGVAIVGLLATLWWVVWMFVRQSRDWNQLARDLIRPEQPPTPSPAHEPPTLRATLPPIDPTDGVIRDPDSPMPSVGSLADAFPRVDPWLIGEPELPETIADTEFVDIEYGPAQVMDEDGNWVPIDEAAQRVEDRE